MSATSSLIQSVLANSRMASSAGREVRTAGGGEVWFELELFEEAAGVDPFAQALSAGTAQVPTMAPGNTYTVRVSATHRPTSYRSIDTTSAIQIFLACRDVPEISISEAKRTVQQAEIATLAQEFELTVGAECRSGEFELTLLWVAHGRRIPNTAASLRFRLDGAYYPVDPELVATCRISLDAEPPADTAILHIVQEQNGYRLTGWSAKAGRLTTEPIEPPTIALAGFVEQKLEPEAIRNTLSSFSRRNSEALLEWFAGLVKAHGEQLSLIIADHSVSELPWEMIEIQKGKYLGAYWRVVRWIPVRNFLAWQNLSIEEEERCGEVLAYLNGEELNVELERQALQQLSTSYCETPALLKQSLSQPLDRVAVVYLGCHGVFTYSEKHQIALGELRNPSERIVALSLEAIQSHEGLRPLLFVNACHSARLIRDSNGFFGLPEVFLALIASAYLGTLGPVGSSHAAKIAKFIFTRAAKDRIAPAEILRELRARAVERLTPGASKDDWLNFIYTFMYVYYGNPFTNLKLVSAAEQKEDA